MGANESSYEKESENDEQMRVHENPMHVQHDSPIDASDNGDDHIGIEDRDALPKHSPNIEDWQNHNALVLYESSRNHDNWQVLSRRVTSSPPTISGITTTATKNNFMTIQPSHELIQHNSEPLDGATASKSKEDLQNYPNDPLEGNEVDPPQPKPKKPKGKVGRPRKREKSK